MTRRALTAEEVAAELGHRKSWIYENWKRLVAAGKIPPPLSEAGHLVWSAAQFYAYLDKDLPTKLRREVAAQRAVFDAVATAKAADPALADEIERWRDKLNHRYGQNAEAANG